MRRVDSRQSAALTARLSAGQARVPGSLNKLTLELQSGADGSESFFLYSEHHVRLLNEAEGGAADHRAPPSASQRQKSQSATPSPQKMQHLRASVLVHWTVRLCQRVNRRRPAADKGGSDTEEDDEVGAAEHQSASGVDTKMAWYMARVDPGSARKLCDELNIERWDELETLIRVACELGRVDVLAREAVKEEDGDHAEADDNDDGRFPDVCLSFALDDLKQGERTEQQKGTTAIVKKEEPDDDDDDDAPRMMLTLTRLDDVSTINEASFVAIEMMAAFGTLRTRTQSLVEERDSHRKLLKDNRRHERFKEASTSLINPGRIKRKVQDDEGFEDE